MMVMLKRLVQIIFVIFALIGIAATFGGLLLVRGGISARAEPGRVETAAARRLRSMAMPSDARTLKNPAPATAETVEEGLAHFADHCAACHANNGSGDTEIGRGLYPKVPDMRQAATQNLSDGELFYIIENGVKLTGMPGWGDGTPESARATWHLVHFIRRLPQLTDADVQRMQMLNPKTSEEWRQEESRTAKPGETPPAPAAPHTHKHGGHK
jgi:mono/diheme cytochrome c family protein